MPRELQSAACSCRIGIDEVGRGALAGPVLLVALALPRRHGLRGIEDSKKLAPRAREEWYGRLKKHRGVVFASASSSARTVDRINVRRAADRAARRAYLRLIGRHPELARASVVLDGGLSLGENIAHRAYIRGDERFTAVACASIVAKVRRDRLMSRLHKRHPAYGFDVHKGYGTRAHRRALLAHGPSAAHRLTFIGKFIRV